MVLLTLLCRPVTPGLPSKFSDEQTHSRMLGPGEKFSGPIRLELLNVQGVVAYPFGPSPAGQPLRTRALVPVSAMGRQPGSCVMWTQTALNFGPTNSFLKTAI